VLFKKQNTEVCLRHAIGKKIVDRRRETGHRIEDKGLSYRRVGYKISTI